MGLEEKYDSNGLVQLVLVQNKKELTNFYWDIIYLEKENKYLLISDKVVYSVNASNIIIDAEKKKDCLFNYKNFYDWIEKCKSMKIKPSDETNLRVLKNLKQFDNVKKIENIYYEAKKGIYFEIYKITGEVIIKVESYYTNVTYLDKNFIKVFKNNLYSIINNEGEQIIEHIYDDISKYEDVFFLVKMSTKLGLINFKGKKILNPIYDNISNFNNDFYKVNLNNGVYLINTEGKLITEHKYDNILKLNDEFFKVQLNGMFGLITNKGELIIKPEYDEISEFRIEFFKLKSNSLFELTNKKGEFITKSKYHEISEFNCLFFKVRMNKLVGLITKKGKQIIESKYDEITEFGSQFFKLKFNSLYELTNKEGEFITKRKYEEISEFNNIFFKVNLNNLFGLINVNGEHIVETKYIDISVFNDFIIKKTENSEYLFDYKKILRDCKETYDIIWKNKVIIISSGKLNGLLTDTGEVLIKLDLKNIKIHDIKNNLAIIKIENRFSLINILNKKQIKSECLYIKLYNHSFFEYEKDNSINLESIKTGKIIAKKSKNESWCFEFNSKKRFIEFLPISESHLLFKKDDNIWNIINILDFSILDQISLVNIKVNENSNKFTGEYNEDNIKKVYVELFNFKGEIKISIIKEEDLYLKDNKGYDVNAGH